MEVWFEGAWIPLEGFILDHAYLRALQQRFATHRGAFCGYGAATPNLHDPGVEWRGRPTYIQKDGINHDYGVYDDPDTFYSRHGVNLSGMKAWLFKTVVRQQMNRNVARIRGGAHCAVCRSSTAPLLCRHLRSPRPVVRGERSSAMTFLPHLTVCIFNRASRRVHAVIAAVVRPERAGALSSALAPLPACAGVRLRNRPMQRPCTGRPIRSLRTPPASDRW